MQNEKRKSLAIGPAWYAYPGCSSLFECSCGCVCVIRIAKVFGPGRDSALHILRTSMCRGHAIHDPSRDHDVFDDRKTATAHSRSALRWVHTAALVVCHVLPRCLTISIAPVVQHVHCMRTHAGRRTHRSCETTLHGHAWVDSRGKTTPMVWLTTHYYSCVWRPAVMLTWPQRPCSGTASVSQLYI